MIYRYLLVFIGIYWCLSVFIGVYRYLLVFIGIVEHLNKFNITNRREIFCCNSFHFKVDISVNTLNYKDCFKSTANIPNHKAKEHTNQIDATF